MDNDNKIDSSVLDNENTAVPEEKGDVLLFLQEEIMPLRKKKVVTTYDLEKEYAKTRKNKNLSVWIVLLLTVVGVVLATWAIISGFSVNSRNIEVSLDAFEDLNLRNLFDALSKTQDLYEKATKTKAELQAAFDQKMTQAKRSLDLDLDYIRKLKLAKKDRTTRETRVRNTYAKTVKAIHDEFDEKLKAADIELKQYEDQLKSFDSENVEKAQEWEKQMDSERQVHEIEKGKLTEEYETKIMDLKTQMSEAQDRNYKEKRDAINDLTKHYEGIVAQLDPVIKDAKVNSAVQKASSLISYDYFDPNLINQSVTYSDDEYLQELRSLQKKYDEYIVLNNFASAIPYSNGMDSIVLSEKQLAYDMVSSVAQVGANRISSVKTENARLSNQVEKYKDELSKLKTVLENSSVLFNDYAKKAKVDGFVLSVTSSTEIIAYIQSEVRPVVKNDGSTRVNIVNNKNEKVASGAMRFKDGIYYVSLDEEAAELLPGFFVKLIKK